MDQDQCVDLEHSDYQNSDSRKTMNGFPTDTSCRASGGSIDTLMDDLKPVVTEKYGFEYGDKSIIAIPFFNFRASRDLDAKNKLNEFSMQYCFSRCRILH